MELENTQVPKKGNLNIFFGYAAGVGKTYAMLVAANEAKKDGIDVVAGYIEPHARPQTQALLEGLEQIPVLEIQYGDICLREFDIDAALRRKPELILVDELAHTNAKGSRHVKRYKDVQELLQAGIDVYTTVNVQHIESINDIVEAVTGVAVRERIPDSVFDEADHVELMDIEPDDLIERLHKGEIYKETQAKKALQNFFTKENLIALREISLRRTADSVKIAVEKSQNPTYSGEYYTEEHILLCLSSAPSNAKVVRTAARMAEAFHCPFTALYVEPTSFAEISEQDKESLRKNIKLAEQLGAKIATVYGDDAPQLVADYAKVSRISKIVVGRSARPLFWVSARNFIDKLSTYAPNLEIFVIPSKEAPPKKEKPYQFSVPKFSLEDSVKSLAILLVCTLVGFGFYALRFSEANIVMVYILGVLVTAVVTDGKVYSGVSSILAVLTFNYFFTNPRYTLEAYTSGYPLTFAVMFASAFLTSTLTKRAKKQAQLSSKKAYRTEVLLETSQLLQRAQNKEQMFTVTARQIVKLLGQTVIFYPAEGGSLGVPTVLQAEVQINTDEFLIADERAVAEWVHKNNRHAGATTNTLPNAKCLYMAVRSRENVFAVVGIAMGAAAKIDAFEKNLLVAMLAECGLAVEKETTLETNNKIVMRAEQEQLRANLLRAISHDLRTPLTGISGNASILMNNANSLEEERRQGLYTDIYDDAMWLINLVENLLSISRIDNGTIALKTEWHLLEEVVQEALTHLNRKSIEHTITVKLEDEMMMAKMDARLVTQVLINVVDNAIKYTQAGSHIVISVKRQDDMAVVAVADDGEGISDASKARLFEMFYTAENPSSDSRRGLGLGLALCKTIVNAQGGDIYVKDNTPCGSIIYFTLPLKTSTINSEHLLHTFKEGTINE